MIACAQEARRLALLAAVYFTEDDPHFHDCASRMTHALLRLIGAACRDKEFNAVRDGGMVSVYASMVAAAPIA
jgi:hypothetical protein